MSQNRKKWLLSCAVSLILLLPPLRRCALAAALGLLLARAAERPVDALERHGIPRWMSGGALILGTVAAVFTLFSFAFSRLCATVDDISNTFPNFSTLFDRLEPIAALLPRSMGRLLLLLIQQLREQSSALPGRLGAWAARQSTALLRALPEKLFFLVISLLSGFYAICDWKTLKKQLLSLIPTDWEHHVRAGLSSLRMGAGGWLRAQGKLYLCQLLLISTGLLLLGIRGAIFAGGFVALADALPLLGSGSVLLPWALLLLLEGRPMRAAGMAALSSCAWLLRTFLEPRLVGSQSGISPFFTLLAMYLGLLSFGFWGLITAPMLLSAGAQLFRSTKGRKHP